MGKITVIITENHDIIVEKFKNNNIELIEFPEFRKFPTKQNQWVDKFVKDFKDKDRNTVIITHSPFIVQAFRFFTHKHNIDNIDFIFIDENGNEKNCNNDIGFIFEKFGEALWNVV